MTSETTTLVVENAERLRVIHLIQALSDHGRRALVLDIPGAPMLVEVRLIFRDAPELDPRIKELDELRRPYRHRYGPLPAGPVSSMQCFCVVRDEKNRTETCYMASSDDIYRFGRLFREKTYPYGLAETILLREPKLTVSQVLDRLAVECGVKE